MSGDPQTPLQQLRERVDELEAAVDRVRRLHGQYGPLAPGRWCPGCGEDTPCSTVRALNGQPDRYGHH